MKPYQKLIGQILAALIVMSSGIILPWSPWIPLNMAITRALAGRNHECGQPVR